MFGETLARSLRETWAAVGNLNLPRAVMGGIALTAHFHPRNTRDIDLLVGIDGTDPDSVLRSLQGHGYRPLRNPALVTVGTDRFFQFYYTPPGTYVDIKVDLLLAESAFHRAALSRRTPVDWPELQLHVEAVSCEDLILLKLAAGRPIDEADVVALIAANRAAIDFAYLKRWLPQLQRVGRWGECWRQAVPGEPDPTATS
jgi:hypothetical protein